MLWTFDRYGKVVVDSMCGAANTLSQEAGAETVELIGYSGGGAIVVGMQSCTQRLVSLTTIAGNLDPQGWASHHGYSPLRDLAPLDNAMNHSIRETHWQCRGDTNIPPAITDGYFKKRSNAIRHIVDDCSHAGGWERYQSRIFSMDASR